VFGRLPRSPVSSPSFSRRVQARKSLGAAPETPYQLGSEITSANAVGEARPLSPATVEPFSWEAFAPYLGGCIADLEKAMAGAEAAGNAALIR
jgi:hypothetical protein